MMDERIKERIFLVGCPRSGTTLLQSLLAAHPQIASFPESHFFKYLVPSRPWLCQLGIASRWARPRFEQFLHEIGHDEMGQRLPKIALFIPQYVRVFVKVLDVLTEQQGKTLWLEKTPSHLQYIDFIEKSIPGAKFIHIIRNGSDVVASLYEVTHKYTQQWGTVVGKSPQVPRKPLDIDQCIHQWVRDVHTSRNHLHKLNHTLVRYEELVENPQSTLMKLCRFTNVSFNETLLQGYTVAKKQVILEREPWKTEGLEGIHNANARKFYELFNEEQRQYILGQLSAVDLDEFSTNN